MTYSNSRKFSNNAIVSVSARAASDLDTHAPHAAQKSTADALAATAGPRSQPPSSVSASGCRMTSPRRRPSFGAAEFWEARR